MPSQRWGSTMTKATHRQWRSLAEVPGDLSGLIDQTGHEPLRVRISYGTLRISRRGTEFNIELRGESGGFCWSRRWPKHEIVRFIRRNTDGVIEFRRAEA